MVTEVTGTKARKSLPETVMVAPAELLAGITTMEGCGTEWVVAALPGFSMILAVTVLVEGMTALRGTSKVVSKAPEESGLTIVSDVPA
jgi:hypothetical protein